LWESKAAAKSNTGKASTPCAISGSSAAALHYERHETMQFLQLRSPSAKTVRMQGFGGYWPSANALPQQFYEMENMAGGGEPHALPRAPRIKVGQCERPLGLHGGSALIWADGTTLYYNGAPVGQVSEEKKQFVTMGSRVLILPDKLILDTSALTLQPVEKRFDTVGQTDGLLVSEQGGDMGDYTRGDTAPAEPEDGALWMDTSQTPPVLMQYSASVLGWIQRTDTAVELRSPGIGTGFEAGDGIRIRGFDEHIDGSVLLLDAGEDFIRFAGILPAAKTVESPVHVARIMPDLDFAVEWNNRIWGCNSRAHEIYACALGDPYNWYCYGGTAADSFAVTVGTPGYFTGAAVHQGAVLFFTEQAVHKIFGTKPANFQMTTLPIEGPMRTAAATLAQAGGELFYQSREGICRYGGGRADGISGDWGSIPLGGCAAGLGSRYYLYLPGKGIVVYDTDTGLWHREDDPCCMAMAVYDGGVYALYEDGGIWCIGGRPPVGQPIETEANVEWCITTGELEVGAYHGRRVRDLCLRLYNEPGSDVIVSVCYDDDNIYHYVRRLTLAGKRVCRLPMIPRYARSLRIRLEGVGSCRIEAVEMKQA